MFGLCVHIHRRVRVCVRTRVSACRSSTEKAVAPRPSWLVRREQRDPPLWLKVAGGTGSDPTPPHAASQACPHLGGHAER